MMYPRIADMDKYTIHQAAQDTTQYGISLSGTFIAYYQLVPEAAQAALLKNLYVVPAYRNNRLSEKFILFATSNLNYRPVILDYRHSAAMRRQLLNLADHFKVTWINTVTGETEPFDRKNPEAKYFTNADDQSDRENWTVMFEGGGKPMPVVYEAYPGPPVPLPDWGMIYECHFPDEVLK